MPQEPSREALLSEIAELKREKADLEMMMEMNTEHSDYLEEDMIRKVETTLRESEKRFRTICETIPVPILITRISDSTAVYVNEHMSSLLGIPVEKLMGRKSLDFLYENPDDRKPLLDTFTKQGHLSNYELRGKKADGTRFWVDLFSQPQTFNDEPCLLSALYDLTDRKQAEEEIRRLNEELERRVTRREGKYLTFALAREEYGISILKVKEIIEMVPVTPVPRTPEFVKGVINLRGKVVPVTDLRLRFGLEAVDYTDRTCIIVAEITRENGNMGNIQLMVGIVVDSVSEVLHIKGSEIEDTPSFGFKLNMDYILGMARIEGEVKILIDIENIFNTREFGFFGKGGMNYELWIMNLHGG